MVAHTFNPSTWEAEAGGFLSSRPVWPTKWGPGQPGLHRETLSRKTNQTNKKKKRWELPIILSSALLVALVPSRRPSSPLSGSIFLNNIYPGLILCGVISVYYLPKPPLIHPIEWKLYEVMDLRVLSSSTVSAPPLNAVQARAQTQVDDAVFRVDAQGLFSETKKQKQKRSKQTNPQNLCLIKVRGIIM